MPRTNVYNNSVKKLNANAYHFFHILCTFRTVPNKSRIIHVFFRHRWSVAFLQIKYVHLFKLTINRELQNFFKKSLRINFWKLPGDKDCGILGTQQADFHFARQIAFNKTKSCYMNFWQYKSTVWDLTNQILQW